MMEEKKEEVDEHLQDVADGIGCAEIWETLSENRKRNKCEG